MSLPQRFLAMVPLAMAVLGVPVAMAQTAPLDVEISGLQQAWAVIEYQAPPKDREAKFAALAAKAQQVTTQFPRRAEPHIWEGIIVSYWAGEKGGPQALGMVKQAKAEFETALDIDPKALDGSAAIYLGILYYRVPGWPVAFGDKSKAETLLKQALAIDPTGLDANYFYGDFMIRSKRYADAVHYLQQALNAPPRPGRGIADAGRKADAQELLAKAQAEQKD